MPARAAAVFVAAGFAVAVAACGGGSDGAAGHTDEAGAEAPGAELVTAEFDVEGMTCGGCALATEMAVKKVEGVRSVDADYDESTGEGRCTVEYDPNRAGPEQVMAAIREAGFRPSLREEGSE